MEYRDVLQYKPLECNPYERYYRKIVRIQPVGAKKSIKGEVVAITDLHLTLEHLDGRKTLVRLSEIGVISEMPYKSEAV
jgi:hypothetical protein